MSDRRARFEAQALPHLDAAYNLARWLARPPLDADDIVQDAMLPREFREVLVLREMEDLSYRDIAQITGAPIGTVMSRLARARGMLKEKWLSDVERSRHVLQ